MSSKYRFRVAIKYERAFIAWAPRQVFVWYWSFEVIWLGCLEQVNHTSRLVPCFVLLLTMNEKSRTSLISKLQTCFEEEGIFFCIKTSPVKWHVYIIRPPNQSVQAWTGGEKAKEHPWKPKLDYLQGKCWPGFSMAGSYWRISYTDVRPPTQPIIV